MRASLGAICAGPRHLHCVRHIGHEAAQEQRPFVDVDEIGLAPVALPAGDPSARSTIQLSVVG
jgi:hypothetical protein